MSNSKISSSILVSSIILGLLLGFFVLLLDFIVSKFISDTGFLFSADNGGLISRTILFFLAMSFVLLLRIFIFSEKIWRTGIQQVDNDYLQLFNSMEFCVVVYSVVDEGRKFIIRDFNTFAEKVEKIKKDAVLGCELRTAFPGVDDSGLTEVMRRVYLTGMPELHDTSKYTDKMRSGWRKNYVFKMRNGDIVCVYQDMTERILFEEKLKETESELESIIKALPFFFMLVDENGILAQVAGKSLKQIGCDVKGAKGKNVAELFKSNSKFLECLSSAKKGLEFSSLIDFGNSVFDVHFHSISFGGTNLNTAVIGHDVSERANVELEKGRLTEAINQSDEIVMVTDSNGIILYTNPAFERVTGFTFSEVFGKNIGFQKSGMHDKSFYEGLWNTIRSGKVWRGHFFNRKKDGSIYEEDAVISPVKNKNGDIINYVAVKRDVTKELELQRQLIQAQKMEAIGRLAGGIAHDFNNILTAILGYSDLALSQIDAKSLARDSVEQIKLAGKRASALTKQLLAFTRKQILNVERVCMKEIISDIHNMIRRIIGEEVSISFIISDENLVAKADRGQIEQVIMNLVLNARDAMSVGGLIKVCVSKHTQKVPFEYSGFSASPGEYIKISITDNGSGMSDDVKLKIFEPFFTTKPKGKGTGLGLSTVYGIVKQHSGFVTFESELGKGTTFDVFLPIFEDNQSPRTTATSSEATENKTTPDEAHPTLNHRGVILVVEDDMVIRTFVASYLSKEGFNVLSAGDGLEAKQILVKGGNEVKLALIDLVMPFMDGAKLAEYITNRFPNIKIILMSGYPDALGDTELNGKRPPLLQKPFSQSELKAVLEKHL